MKKKISLALLVILAAFTLIGCGKQMTDAEKFVGTWELDQNGDPESWTETLVVFSDGTAYSTSYPNNYPDNKFEALYNSWTMENGYLKYNLTAMGYTEDALSKYEFVDRNTLILGTDRSEDEWSYYHRVKE